MGRIRTIKPEFPQSESMGRVSRDARLLFIELWTLADDSGRTRGNPKMIASLLFPYDDDAPGLIDGWLDELEKESCIIRYQAEGQNYIQIVKWEEHQKIDKPTPSKFPGPDGSIERRRSERDIETTLFDMLKSADTAFGRKVVDVQRQVRIGSSYLDMVVTTEGMNFILELKKNRLSIADLKQVDGYAKTTGGAPILIGPGLSPLFPTDEAEKLGVAVATIADDNTMTLIVPSNNVKDCSIMLSSVTRCYPLDQGPRIKDQGSHTEERELSTGKYPEAIFKAWHDLGDKVNQPSSIIDFLTRTYGVEIHPVVRGIHSDEVLAAISNFGRIVTAPAGKYWWTRKIGIGSFFQKHLDKFLPANFRESDFLVTQDKPAEGPPKQINGYLVKDRACGYCGATIHGTLDCCPMCGWTEKHDKDAPEMIEFYTRNLNRKKSAISGKEAVTIPFERSG